MKCDVNPSFFPGRGYTIFPLVSSYKETKLDKGAGLLHECPAMLGTKRTAVAGEALKASLDEKPRA